jgi:HNH endonuclease
MKWFHCTRNPCHEVQVIDWSKTVDGGPVPYSDMTGKPCPICGEPLLSEDIGRKSRLKQRNKRILKLIERDGTNCWICGMEVPSDLLITAEKDIHSNSLAAYADHVIPVSKGGTRALENLRLTHCCCNVRRGNQDLTPELILRCQSAVEWIKQGRPATPRMRTLASELSKVEQVSD